MKPATITHVSEIPAEESVEQEQPKGKVEKKAGKRVGYNYIIVKSYKESQKNDVVKCLYIKSLTKWGFCVIKEGCHGDTKDKNGRDIIDRLKWQKQLHEQLQDKIRIPRLLGHFEERGNYYLVIEHIKGRALQKVRAENATRLRSSIITGGSLGMRFLNYLIQIAGILEILHAQGIVHRDATPNNYLITSKGKVALIDMEMCYSLPTQYPSPPFPLGTYGYMSEQQESIMSPTTAEDIFALGAIVLQMWSGISPGKMTREPFDVLTKKIRFFIPDKQVADITIRCLSPEDQARPVAAEVKQVLQQYNADLKYKVIREINQPEPINRSAILATVQEGCNTLASPLLTDEEKGWFADDMASRTEDDRHKLRKQWYASYNRGISGVIYFLAQAQKAGLDIDATLPFVEKGMELVREKYIQRIRRAATGLHYGSDGIAAVMATAIKERLLEASDEHREWIELLLEKSVNVKDFFRGIAGQGIANMVSQAFISPQKLQERLLRYAEFLINKQHASGCWANGYYRQKITRRRIKKVSRGFAEGIAGIAFFLMEYGYKYQHQASKDAAHKGLQWLMKKGKQQKGSIQWVSSSGKELHFSWGNGIAGIAFVLLRAFQLSRMAVYKDYTIKTLNSIPTDLTDTNIGQISGLSGLGEVYLEAYKVLGDNEWLQRAGWVAQVVMQLKKLHPKHGSYWLVEHERQPVANFMVGNAGVMHFLLRYCFPDKIDFPLVPEY